MVSYAIAESFVGKVLVIATDKGVSHISFGDSTTELEAIAEKNIKPSIGRFITVPIDDVLAVINGENREIPIDLNGTQFQMTVLNYIMRIPKGKRVTYDELTESIGMKHVKPVMRVCDQNPIAVLIPCHRVVGKKDLGNYRWGVHRKSMLLLREAGLT